jgi:GNAT superfamily N-acetyltransferase
MTDFKIIEYKTDEYRQMVSLRTKILREPLGLTFSEEDLDRDRNDLLLAACFPDSCRMVGCCILTPLSEATIQLRQMAVDDFYQGKGLGSELLQYAEQVAVERNFEYLYLHARKVAVGFYKKQGYTIEGDLFTEVGIPHFEMMKRIK